MRRRCFFVDVLTAVEVVGGAAGHRLEFDQDSTVFFLSWCLFCLATVPAPPIPNPIFRIMKIEKSDPRAYSVFSRRVVSEHQIFGSAGLAYATAALTVTTLFFGELLPKALGVNNAEVVARRVLPIIIVLSVVLNPVAKTFTLISSVSATAGVVFYGALFVCPPLQRICVQLPATMVLVTSCVLFIVPAHRAARLGLVPPGWYVDYA